AVDRLPSGAYRVRVYAGTDPVSGKRHDLIEVVPPGRRAAAGAEKARTRLLNQVDEKRNPRTRATVNQLMDRYLDVLDVGERTRASYVGYVNRYIRPVLGRLPAGAVDGETLDSLYAELRRCRDRCDGRQRTDHRAEGAHDCNERCRAHVCRPLAAASIRQLHWVLSGAYERAVRWRWVAVSPVPSAQPPAPPRPNPTPPSPEEAARILAAAWEDPAWGAFLWLAMTTGARRGELCALRRRDLDLDQGVLTVHASVYGRRSAPKIKDTKTHQQRRIALDAETIDVLRRHTEEQDAVAARLGVRLDSTAFLFSGDPDCSTPPVPDSVSQRYDRLVTRLGISTTLHKLRHYNATELLSAGVDLRTVAGRLGHGGGGTTTLKVYAAWVSEADRQAASAVAARLPRPPEA
ncbi:MAG: tyrosine-type recombinase/integrase, partial [Actinomycetales bacterium]